MLGMYDMPALQPANDRFWASIHAHLGEGPAHLTRDRDFWEIWQDPDLVFAQTCGMPFRTQLHGKVHLVGTPDYGLPGCPPGYYCSVFVARTDDDRPLAKLTAGVFAFNEALSHSGWASPVTHLAGLGLAPGQMTQSGGHARSAQAVADGKADYAALDALTWKLLVEHTDISRALRPVATTAPTPALPYITALRRDPTVVASAVRNAIGDLSAEDRRTLHIRGLIDIPPDRYLAVPNPPAPEAFRPEC
ncbi:MAG: phosphate/phosphite/phosphonate ABC transporter substrate-binding protein [Ruegeria sp.]